MLNNMSMESGFFVAIFLVVVIVLMPLFSKELRKSESIMFGYWFVIFLHQIVAFLNAYLYAIGRGGTLGARLDANYGFHHTASELALHGNIFYRSQYLSVPLSLDSFMKGGAFYYEMLGTVYKWFGAVHFLGEQLSILAFAFSCIIFLKIIRQLEIERYTAFSLICFGALPSVVLHGAVTLREPYEVLFFILAVYFGLKISLEKKIGIFFICLMILSAFLMGVFHGALIIYAIFLILLFLVWTYSPISRFGNIKKQHLMAMMFMPLFFSSIIVVSEMGLNVSYFIRVLLRSLDVDALINFVTWWRGSSMSLVGRTSYDIPLDPSSPLMLLFSSLKIFGYYLFAGLSWPVNNFIDAYAAVEAIFRLTLIIFSVRGWWKAVGLQKRLLGLMLILYFSMSFMWAMGTTNYGTAIRHNLVAWWIISIMGVPQLIARLKHIWSIMMCRYSGLVNRDIIRLKT
jgi:hypothetical protein